MFLPTSSSGTDAMLRHKRLILDVSFTGATPSTSVRHASDAPSAVYLASEGVDDAAADDSGANFGTLTNNSAGASTVGILIDGPKTLGGLVSKLYSLSVTEVTSTAGTVSSSLKGASTTGITASGNIAFTVSGTAANLDTDTVTYRCVVECKIDEDQTP